ncbi:probable L-type lectin-domain containing receptor kinase S.7 [Cynara cardunculus var. scolymus]|uniref:Concanavalin A-like lectin/glucanase superfamily n=1 Tax=Cynara cardunculus var. scolymus TaxID=59895 RepID=A0A118K2Y5_CYNCS|nr:probable L-type lectin-domain containing receptor kinase S.7 [Cynara cardunculus var. scolymus]KVI05100.1 Concanavalin A-like lectin/glucanase superfamily [Cynara cardunculus var. scolymus]
MASIALSLPTMMKLLAFIVVFFVYVESIDQQKPDNGVIINVTKRFSFPDFQGPRTAHDLKLLGSSVVDETGRVRIPDTTQKDVDLKHLAGRAVYAYPIRVFDPVSRTPASFETTFAFQLETLESNSSSGDENGGDGGGSGFTFMFAPDEFTVGRPGPWLGMLNDACDEEYKAVGIEFDTRENVEFGDPNDNHVGINLGSIVSTITINASEFGVNLNDGEIHRVWVEYSGESRFLDIRLGSDRLGYPSKPMFSDRLDISDFLKEYMFVGFSASTGNFAQIHNVFSWNFTSTSQASLRVPSPETCDSKLITGDGDDGGGAHINRLNGFFIFMTVVLLVALALVSLYYNRKHRSGNKSNEAVMLPAVKERPRPPNKPRRFTIAEISSATRCFDELHKVASDERGDTYRGTLLNGCHVAVTKFSTSYLRSHGVYWRRVGKEIKAMSKLRHPNLVAIRGWCFDHQETMVVYDYVPNGTFNEWLYGIGVLPWSRRLRVVRDAAQALSYLHSQKHAHKNVTTSSVFIDVSFRAMLGDFGFVMSGTESNQFEAAVSQPADVFSFGVLVLEVVAGRKRYKSESDLDGSDSDLDRDLLEWAWIMHEMKEKEKVVDGKMCSVLNMDQAVHVMDIGLLCTLQESKGRPSMAEVVEYVSFEKEVPELPASRPMALFPYTSTTGLCSSSYMCPSFK